MPIGDGKEHPFAYQPSGSSPEEQGELSICIFPHLTEFLVIDARKDNPDGPRLCHLTTSQVLDEQFFREVEADFRELLRRSDQPLPYLMTLPQQLDPLLRHKALNAVVTAVNGGVAAKLPNQVAILFCAGDILTAPASQIEELFQQLTGGETDAWLISEWTSQFEKLQAREQFEIQREQDEQRQKAVKPNDGEFYTLWENPG